MRGVYGDLVGVATIPQHKIADLPAYTSAARKAGETACVREGQRPLAISDNDRGIVEREGAAREFQNQTHL